MQLPAGATEPAFGQVPPRVNSVALAPEVVIEVMSSASVPALVSVIVSAALVALTSVFGNTTDVRVSEIVGTGEATAAPTRGIAIAGTCVSANAMFSVAARALPTAVGLKMTWIVHVDAAAGTARPLAQVPPEIRKSAALAPVIVSALAAASVNVAALPTSCDTVTVNGALSTPTAVLGNPSAWELILARAAGVAPTAAR